MKKLIAAAFVATLSLSSCAYDNGYYDNFGHYHYYDSNHIKGNEDNRWDGNHAEDWNHNDNHDWHNPGTRRTINREPHDRDDYDDDDDNYHHRWH